MRLARIASAISALSAISASFYLLLSPVTIHKVPSIGSTNRSFPTEEPTRYASLYQVQGAWGVLVLIIFALLFVSVALRALKKRYVASAALSTLAGILVLLAGFSIGPFYFPAVALVLLAWLVLGAHGLSHARRSASA